MNSTAIFSTDEVNKIATRVSIAIAKGDYNEVRSIMGGNIYTFEFKKAVQHSLEKKKAAIFEVICP